MTGSTFNLFAYTASPTFKPVKNHSRWFINVAADNLFRATMKFA